MSAPRPSIPNIVAQEGLTIHRLQTKSSKIRLHRGTAILWLFLGNTTLTLLELLGRWHWNLLCRIFLEVDISGSVGFEVIQFNARVCGRTSFDDCGQHMFSLVAILNSNNKYPPSGYLAVESSYVSRGTQAGIFHCSRDVVNDYHWSYSPVSSI